MIFRLILLLSLFIPTGRAMAESLPGDWEEIGSIPMPSWQTVDDPLRESVYDTLTTHPRGNTQTIHEFLPKGQNDQNWRKRYWFVTSTNVTKSPKAVMNSALRRMGDDCATKSLYGIVQESSANVLFLFACGKMRDSGLGQLSMIWLGKSGSTLLRVSEDWRGPVEASGRAFLDAQDEASFLRTLQLLKSTRLK